VAVLRCEILIVKQMT